jgi:hypothetical protein
MAILVSSRRSVSHSFSPHRIRARTIPIGQTNIKVPQTTTGRSAGKQAKKGCG